MAAPDCNSGLDGLRNDNKWHYAIDFGVYAADRWREMPEGTWFLTSPGSVVVHKTKNDLLVVCRKDGYNDTSLTIPSKFGGATAANIIAGGVIGLGVDAASGANYSYPANTVLSNGPRVVSQFEF